MKHLQQPLSAKPFDIIKYACTLFLDNLSAEQLNIGAEILGAHQGTHAISWLMHDIVLLYPNRSSWQFISVVS